MKGVRFKGKCRQSGYETPQNGVFHSCLRHVIHFSVKQVGLLDGLDLHLFLYPVGALFGNALLLKPVYQFQPIGIDDEGWLAEKEIEVVHAVKTVLEHVTGIDSEVSRDD